MKYVTSLDNSEKIIQTLFSSRIEINNFESIHKSFDWLPDFISKMRRLEVIDISSKEVNSMPNEYHMPILEAIRQSNHYLTI